ncbi:MAG: Trk family potassium uptake protein [Clostridia bacterium]|nr:Trk family potassium uptake protein [Clostridia bacterium]
MKKKFKIKLTVWRLLALAYLAGMILGSILLILPFATREGQQTSYLNALFTATSAVCITGLSPYDIATHWSLFGQIVILLLVQMSGLGFMTLVSAAFLIFKHGMGLGSRNAFMLDSRGNYTGIKTLLKRIVAGTLICETVGALLLMIQFIPEFGAGKGIYYSVWHSISAFCNAGFDLLGTAENGGFVSLTSYATNPLVNLTVSALVILGGLGFAVWGDVIDCRFKYKKFQLNTKVVLIMTGILLVLGTALFMIFERNDTQADMNFGQRLLVSFFESVTPRSAGFATTHCTSLSNSGYLLTVLLMFVGGGSGSTAGGIRIGTFAVLLVGMTAACLGRRDINIGKRRIEYSLLWQALAILASFLTGIVLSTLVIGTIQPEADFKEVVFECVSALTNTGLTMDFTPKLGIASSLIIIFLMYAGRIGVFTLTLALGKKRNAAEIRKPIDTLLIG